MNIEKISQLIDGKIVTQTQEHIIEGVYVGDLLSWVMGHTKPNQIWITVQSHLNVIAVAALRELGGLIICEGAQIEQDCIDKANEENIPIILSPLPAFEICVRLKELSA